jgi:hypothetical protein
VSSFGRVDLSNVDVYSVMLEVVLKLLLAVLPALLDLHFGLLGGVEGLGYYSGDSMVGKSRIASHNCIAMDLLKRSPELSRTATGLLSLVCPPMRKMQLRPREKE